MDLNLLEQVNPVFNTAKMTVFQLAALGDKDAAEIVEKLNLTFEQTQNSATSKTSPELMALNNIMLETRYRTSVAIAQHLGYKTIVDLPCGYTPRAKMISQKGITYYGLDLPAAIAEAEPVILSMIDEDKQSLVHFCGVDATNGESLKNALKDAEGPLCITTEGLLMYFSDSEAGALQHLLLRSALRKSVECVNSAVSTEKFVISVCSLSNAVGIYKYAVALFKLYFCIYILGYTCRADRQPMLIFKNLVFAVLVYHRILMSRARANELACADFEYVKNNRPVINVSSAILLTGLYFILRCYTTLSELLVTTQKRNLGIAAYKKRRGFDFRAVLFIFLFH